MTKKVLHTTARNLGIAAQNRSVKNLIANHINPRYSISSQLGIEMIYEEIRENYKGKFFVADDLDIYYLSRDGFIKRD